MTAIAQLQQKKVKKVLNYKSCFDIIGPIMIGPSSSHTAGAIAIGQVAHKLFKSQPTEIVVKYYESFAETHKGHGTDYAIVSGILGFATDDPKVPHALAIAESKGIKVTFLEMPGNSPVNHPNTACITLKDATHEIHVTGISIGGGSIEVKYIEIDGFTVEPQGTLPILIVLTKNELLKGAIENKLTDETIKINKITRYKHQGQFLFEFDLDIRPSDKIKSELIHFDNTANIILL